MTQAIYNPPRVLSPIDKAAILLLTMGEEGAADVIRKLAPADVESLSAHMATISNVTQEELGDILGSFFLNYQNESGLSGTSRLYLERALDKALGRKLARGMLDNIYGGELSDDIRRLEWVPPEILKRFLEREHIQMQALMLAFLSTTQASAVLELFPQERHDDLLYRIASLKEVSEYLMEELRHTVEACIEYVGEQAGTRVNGVEKVADIMNRYNGNKVEMMELLKCHDSSTAAEIEERMFDFNTLLYQSEDVISYLFSELPDELWLTALRGCEEKMLSKLFASLSSRLEQVYRQQLKTMDAVPTSKVESSRKELMSMIRSITERGEIDYRLYEEAVE